MGDAVSTTLPGPAVQSEDQSLNVIPSQATEPTASVDLLAVLRQGLAEGSQPPAAIMHAAYNFIFFATLFSQKGNLPTSW